MIADHCPICSQRADLIEFKCCNRCNNSLAHKENVDCYDIPPADGLAPLISSQIIDECSIAIASSRFEEISCMSSDIEKEKSKYYRSMNDWINMIGSLNDVSNGNSIPEDEMEATSCIRFSTYLAFGLNLILMIGKTIALSTSSSYTIISSVVDSFLDLIAGIIISCTASHSKFTREDMFRYPVGKSRVSTVGVLIFSSLMACCALYIILECTLSIVSKELPPKTTTTAYYIMIGTIVLKLIMWIAYNLLGHPITDALAEDDRNDVLTNGFGLFMYWGGNKLKWWMDAAGGLIISVFVFISWSMNTLENAKMLLGEAAPDDIKRAITYVAGNHHPLIISIEQVIAFQAGPMYFTELHIIMPGDIPMEVAHWIGESLQLKIEKIPQIERAWVHIDCESHTQDEHMLLIKNR